MDKMIRNVFRVATALLAGSLLWISSAGALPMHLIVSASGFGTCFDSGVVAGPAVSYVGPCGAIFTTNIEAGTQSGLPSLDLGSSNITSAGIGDLTVTLFLLGVTSPVGLTQWLQTFTGSWVTANAGTFVSSADFVNGIALPVLLSKITPFALTNTANIAGLTAPYDLEMIITIHSTGANSFSLDEQLQGRVVPEPATLLLLGTGLLGLAALRRKQA